MIELWQLFLAAVAYLGLLFLIAYAAEEGWLPAGVARHPLTYTLSLGVYATTWSFYGSVGLAANQGYSFLAIYIGVTLAFALTPTLLAPLLRLVREYQLSSLADVFAFRYPSAATGVLVTLFMLAGILPYISLQIQAVTSSVQVLTREAPPDVLALVFCLTVTLFAVLFGARQVTPREKHEGLVVAIAFESVIKLVALLAVGAFALHGVFGGLDGLEDWLARNPQAVDRMYQPLRDGAWPTLLLLAFSAAFLLPRQFHMLFAENIDPNTLRVASWAFPLFLLALNLAIPPVLWSAQALGLPGSPDYYVLGLAQRESSGALALFAFVGGISAASAMIIVESLALAAMVLNHLVLPLWLPLWLPREEYPPPARLYVQLLWWRRALIALVIFTGYAAYVAIEGTQALAQLGLISFVAVAQFLPGVFGLLLWPRATRVGFLAGLSGGMALWFALLVWPLVTSGDYRAQALYQLFPMGGLDKWEFATFWSLGVNMLLFAGGSLLSRPGAKELAAAQASRLNAPLLISARPRLRSAAELEAQLAPLIGADTARAELERALGELQLAREGLSPRQMHFLQERITRNLSGLLGPRIARELVAEPEAAPGTLGVLIEEELEQSPTRLRGLAAELDHLRRFHRQILHDLPIGVCSLDAQRAVVIWNERMAAISGLAPQQVLGASVASLPPPWAGVFARLLDSTETRLVRHRAVIGERTRWLNVHREAVAADEGATEAGTVLLVEDLTDQRRLEAELAHSERLASIGRFAAGVAHEIGNPLTGITSLAQNMRAETADPALQAGADEILEQGRRIGQIVKSLLSFSHSGDEWRRRERFPLAGCVDEAVRLVRLSQTGRSIAFEPDIAAGIELEGERGRLLQVLVNLLINAADASAADGRVQILAEVAAGWLTLRVRDYGAGIPEHLHERVFEPFFTTKDPGRGTGLGLPLAYGIVREHGGAIHLDSAAGRGTTFTLRLPGARLGGEAPATAP
jgi:PAS domain S-box-containing protein